MAKVTVSGHRPSSLPGGFRNTKLHSWIKKQIKRHLTNLNPELVITGMALGFDQWVAEVCLDMGIPFIAALPFKGQETRWPPKSQQHYKYLLSKASKIVFVDREPGYISSHIAPDIYHPDKMLTRNKWMVDQLRPPDAVLALMKPDIHKGGTYHAVQYYENVWSMTHGRAGYLYKINPFDYDPDDLLVL